MSIIPSQTSDSGGFIQVPSDLEKATASDLWGRNEELPPLTSEQCTIGDPWLIGFDMQAKRWGKNNIPDRPSERATGRLTRMTRRCEHRWPLRRRLEL